MDRIGRYEIITELGRGAMGIVYKARDPKIGREVAIKTIRLIDQAAPSETVSLRDRLFREAQSAGRLSHPGIVTIYDIAEESGLAYITMEFVEGRTLEHLMHSGAARDAEFSADFLQQTAAALDYAHGKDIVHRDIKPANMMITPEGGVKITDFGIARIASSQLTQTGTVMGTPSYMSPEQVRGDGVDGRSDQFSLGVIAYELLTGQKPFVGESLTSVIFKIVSSEPVPPRQLRPGISPVLEAAILKGLAKDAASRYSTCRLFAQAIEDACGCLTGSSPPAPPQEQARSATAVEADLTAPALARSAPPKVDSEQTMPLAAAKAAKLPPLASQRSLRGLIPGMDTTATRRRRSRRGWLWLAVLVMLAAGGAAGWFYLLPQLSMDDALVAEKLVPPGPPADILARQVETLRQGATVAPMRVSFNSNQPGARVVVDGRDDSSCTTPCSVELMPGQYQAVASLQDYLAEGVGFEVGAEPVELTFELKPVPPTAVRFTSLQRGVRVVVDGDTRLACNAPCSLNLKRGMHKAVASAANFNSAEETFEVGADSMQVSFDLRALPPVPVQFSSEPAGARLVVDGRPQWACTTPCSLDLPRGRHEYLASETGFRTVRGNFEVGNEPSSVSARLERIVGTLMLSSEPSGASVYVDGRKQDAPTSTRLDLPPGYHLIRVESGSRASERSVAVQEGELRTMHFVLGAGGALRATLSVKTTPPGASIVLNDINPGGQSPRDLNLAPGTYRVTLSLPGYRPVIREVELAPNATQTLDVALSSQN